MRFFNKISMVILFIFCLTLVSYAQTQKIDIDGDGEKETIQIKKELVGNNLRGMIFIYKNLKNIFPASVENGYTIGTSFYTICTDPEHPKRKMIIIVCGIGDEKNNKMIYSALIFQYFPEFNAYHNSIDIKTKQYHRILCFVRSSNDRQKIKDKIVSDILKQLHNNKSDIRRVPFENYTYKTSEDLLLNQFINAARAGNKREVKSLLYFVGGPHPKPGEFEEDIDRIVELFKMAPAIISVSKCSYGVNYSIYFHVVNNYVAPDKPYLELSLFKNQKQFGYIIYQ